MSFDDVVSDAIDNAVYNIVGDAVGVSDVVSPVVEELTRLFQSTPSSNNPKTSPITITKHIYISKNEHQTGLD